MNDVSPGPPWIKVTAHKDGTPSENILVRNNLATDYQLEGTNVTNDHNTQLGNDLAMFFVDPAKFDLHLLPGAPAVDSGSADMAPMFDIEGIPRPQGKGVDLGAYEWHDPSVMPATGSGGGGGAGGAGGAGGGNAGGSTAAGGQGGSAGNAGSAGSAGSNGDNGSSGGCGCALAERSPAGGWALLALALGLAGRRERRPRRSAKSPERHF